MKINSWENRSSGPESGRSGPDRAGPGLSGGESAMARIAAGAGKAAGSGYPAFPARRLRGRAGARTFPVASSSRQPFM